MQKKKAQDALSKTSFIGTGSEESHETPCSEKLQTWFKKSIKVLIVMPTQTVKN